MNDIIDARGMLCPLPVLKLQKNISAVPIGATLSLLATDPMAPLDIRHFCHEAGQEFVSETKDGDAFCLVVKRLK